MKPDTWNRCDICGKFIAYEDFYLGKASCELVQIETPRTNEKYEVLCSQHKEQR